MCVLRTWLLRVTLLLATCMGLLAVATSASAGTLQVKDTEGLLSAADTAALRAEGERLPFDVRVVTTADHPDKSDLDRYVHEQLSSPNMVVIGVDKAHRHTAVHFGTATGVPASEFRAIEQAGNAGFRDGNWRAGISAILTATRAEARERGAAPTTSAAPASVKAGSGASTAMWGLVVVLVVAGLIVFVGVTLARRARSGMLGSGDANALPPGGYPPGGPAPYPPGSAPGPGGYPPAPGYGYPPGYGAGGGIGRNIAAAGLGGLVGYELGKMAGDHGQHVGTTEQSAAIGGRGDEHAEHADVDAGGAAGGWDDDASGNERGDSGWGGGDTGGGDWGGGDSGGGGSDW